MLFSLRSCKRYVVLSASLSIDGTNILRPPPSLGTKRVCRAIGSVFLLFNKNLKMILFISYKRSLGREKMLHTYQSLESNFVFSIIVFPFRKSCLCLCNFTLFSIFWIHFVILNLFVISGSLLKWMPKIFTKFVVFTLLETCCYYENNSVWISSPSVLFIFSKHPVAFLYN